MKYFLFFLILFLMLFLLNNEQNVITVINNDEPIYNEYMLEVEEITTKNFIKYKKNIKLKKYYFDFNTINKNILNFEKSFILNLKQCGFNNEATNIQAFGIKINKILVFDSAQNINDNLQKLKYRLTFKVN